MSESLSAYMVGYMCICKYKVSMSKPVAGGVCTDDNANANDTDANDDKA